MKKIFYLGLITLSLAACEQEKDKVAELQEAKKELKELQKKISELEKEISSSDTVSTQLTSGNAVLVSTLEIEKDEFIHAIEVRGSVESRRNILISAETGGTIQRVHVEEGQRVSKGTVLISLDAEVIRNNVATLQTQLELATAIFERQKRLWEKNIGTEVQYLEAKNRKETLEAQLATANSQLAQAVVRAPFNGVIDAVPAREGEFIQPGMPLVRLLNPEKMYIKADVSERYIGRFKAGDKVEIYFPSQQQTLMSTLTSVSHVINEENRTFSVEVSIPEANFPIRPNQVTVLNLQDYVNEDAISIPTNIVRRDKSGSYVFTLRKDEEGFLVANKTPISTGVSFDSKTEVLEGLDEGDVVVEKGISELTDGAHVQLPTSSTSAANMASGNN